MTSSCPYKHLFDGRVEGRQAVDEDDDTHHRGRYEHCCVEAEPREVDGHLHPEVLADVVEWLVTVPSSRSCPRLVQQLSAHTTNTQPSLAPSLFARKVTVEYLIQLNHEERIPRGGLTVLEINGEVFLLTVHIKYKEQKNLMAQSSFSQNDSVDCIDILKKNIILTRWHHMTIMKPRYLMTTVCVLPFAH